MILVRPDTALTRLVFTPRVYAGSDLDITITEKGSNNPVEIWVFGIFIQGGGQGNIAVAIMTSNQFTYPVQYDFKDGQSYDLVVRIHGDPSKEIRYRDTIYCSTWDVNTDYNSTLNAGKLAIDVNGDNDAYIILED
mgnify:FL=1